MWPNRAGLRFLAAVTAGRASCLDEDDGLAEHVLVGGATFPNIAREHFASHLIGALDEPGRGWELAVDRARSPGDVGQVSTCDLPTTPAVAFTLPRDLRNHRV
jgi:hypothetical protein